LEIPIFVIMSKCCIKCSELKPQSDFRNRNTCKSCENKERYKRKKLQRMDLEYDKKCKKYDVQRKRKKERECPLTYFKQLIRQSVRKAINRKKYSKKSKTYIILGGEWEVVKLHFESLFQPGMSWDNYGQWEIDHIIPLAIANTEDEVIKLCHYKNLQPLWKVDNIKKGTMFIQST
jgi:hypothetical protein